MLGGDIGRDRQISRDHGPANLAIWMRSGSTRHPSSKKKKKGGEYLRKTFYVDSGLYTDVHTYAHTTDTEVLTSTHPYTTPTQAVTFQHVFWKGFSNRSIFIFHALSSFLRYGHILWIWSFWRTLPFHIHF